MADGLCGAKARKQAGKKCFFGEKIVNAPYQDVTRNNTDMIFIQDFSDK